MDDGICQKSGVMKSAIRLWFLMALGAAIVFGAGALGAQEEDISSTVDLFIDGELSRSGEANSTQERYEELLRILGNEKKGKAGEQLAKLEKLEQKLRNAYSRRQANIYDGNIGIIFGFMLGRASGGKGDYFDQAFVDPTGFVRVKNRLSAYNNVMPSITLHWSYRESLTGWVSWMCLPGERAILGISLGLSPQGRVDSAKGSAMALAGTWGYYLKTDSGNYLFGVVAGGLWDNTIQTLGSGYLVDQLYPFQTRTNFLRASTAEEIAGYSAIDLPQETINGRYSYFGIVISANVNFGASQ